MSDKPIPIETVITMRDLEEQGIRYALNMATEHYPVSIVQNGQPSHVILNIDDYQSFEELKAERNAAVNELARFEAEHHVGRSFASLDALFADLHSDSESEL